MRSYFLTVSLFTTCGIAMAQLPPHLDLTAPEPLAAGPSQRPANCEVIYDSEQGQGWREIYGNPLPCCNVRRSDGLILDALAVDDFDSERPGRITDAFIVAFSCTHCRGPADGVRIYLWGTGEAPAEEPTGVWDIPPEQVQSRSLGWWLAWEMEIHATGLDIPFSEGRNWITIQPRDWTQGANSYYLVRDERRPVQGADALVKDGPDGEVPGYGFTDWRTAESQGFGAADSYLRLEGCFDLMTIAVEGECGAAAQFSWSNAPPESPLTFLYAKQTGSVRIPPNLTCGGTQLGLGQRLLQIAFSIETGQGSGTVERFLPAPACPGHFQALIREPTGPCEVSNVVGTP